MGRAWNGWYHCIVGTYGSWLRGDPRGWRARHHREHCDGDYRSPPPAGKYRYLFQQSERLMKRDAVRLGSERLREFVVREFVARLQQESLDVLAAALDDHHLHVLVRCADVWAFPAIRTSQKSS